MEAYWAILTGLGEDYATIHSSGMPRQLGGAPKPLPLPHIVVIEHRPDGWSIFRLTSHGEDAGDTWHESLDDAKHQLEFEYGDAVGPLLAVPDHIADPQAYALLQA